MRFRYAALAACFLLVATGAATAQVIFPGQSGDQLLGSLAADYRPSQVLSLADSKDRLYDTIDRVTVDGEDGTMCIYTGYFVPFDCDPSCDPSQDVYNNGQGINQEHTWPRSQGATGIAERDMHHLFPTRVTVNSARGNLPFGESPDASTTAWYYLDLQQSAPPPLSTRDLWSERLGSTLFEPREEKKGDVARALFYFYTMYGPHASGQANDAFFEEMREVLLDWHAADPPTDEELERNERVAQFQTTSSGLPAVNPYVVDVTLAARAFGDGTAVPEFFFATASATVPLEEGPFDIPVRLVGAGDDASVTVAYTGGTARPGVDFDFSEQTLTFPTGTTEQTATVTLLGEEAGTIVLELQNPSAGVELGHPASFTLTLTDGPGGEPGAFWVNELHYDNVGVDEGEFVEIALESSIDPARVTLTLYNGSGGGAYGTYAGSDWIVGDAVGDVTFYWVDLPTNGIQNGAPDGLSVDLDGEVVQFLSYEGTFMAIDGPAAGMMSTDIGVEQTGSTPIGTSLSLTGTGVGYEDFAWTEETPATPGALNAGQAFSTTAHENTAEPLERALSVYPNPTRDRATVAIDLAEPGTVHVEVYDVLGRRVLTIVDGPLPAGRHALSLDGGALTPGTYLIRLSGARRGSARVLIVR